MVETSDSSQESLQEEGRFAALVLAAGKGTRMRSELPKPLVPLRGRPIVDHLGRALRRAGFAPVMLVVGHGAHQVRRTLGSRYRYATQDRQLGTGHAVMVARDPLHHLEPRPEHLFVSVGDSPLLREHTLRQLRRLHLDTGADCTFLTGVFQDPLPYARVIRDAEGRLLRCVEERDATPEERAVRELFTSHYLFRFEVLWDRLAAIPRNPSTGEYYLTDIVGLLIRQGASLRSLRVDDPRELVGLNTPEELAWADRVLDERAGEGTR